jgi:hypothetical protein
MVIGTTWVGFFLILNQKPNELEMIYGIVVFIKSISGVHRFSETLLLYLIRRIPVDRFYRHVDIGVPFVRVVYISWVDEHLEMTTSKGRMFLFGFGNQNWIHIRRTLAPRGKLEFWPFCLSG